MKIATMISCRLVHAFPILFYIPVGEPSLDSAREHRYLRTHSRPKLDLQCYKLMNLSKTKCPIETN